MGVLKTEIGLWEGKWSPSALKRRRKEIGEREFSRGWRQRAVSDEEVLFKLEHIEACKSFKHKLFYPGYDDTEEIPKSFGIYMGVDLAITSAKNKGDYFAITVIGVDRKEYTRRILGFYRNRGLTFNEQLLKVEQWGDYFGPHSIFVESNAYQQAFTQELKLEMLLPTRQVA